MHHLLAYEEDLASNAADADLDAAVDGEFSQRNSHYIFTEQYNLLAAHYIAPNATRARFNLPSLNGIGRHQIWPLNRSATVPSRPGIQDLRGYPMPLTVNEELGIEGSNDDGVDTDQAVCLLWIASPQWTPQLPRGLQRLVIAATAAPTGVAVAWSGDAAITFLDNLRGGWYTVVGMQVFDAGAFAYRLNFRNSTTVNNRKLRPGCITQEAIGNTPDTMFMGGLGVWGHFHSFEPPTVQCFNLAAGATAGVIRLDVIYHGERRPF